MMSINTRSVLVASLMLILSGCTSWWHAMSGEGTRQGVSSSLVDYLYPQGEIPPEQDFMVPTLEVPVDVGLAFVPASEGSSSPLSEAEKTELLERARAAFMDRKFIRDITVIPETYLRSNRGFNALEGVGRLYGIDVIALVSYDQVAHVDDNKASFLYWTIIGAYIVKGSEHDVQTFVDTAVFDLESHKLLFRAPGVNHLEDTSTLVNSPEEMREARANSFSLAMADMTTNLGLELDEFRVRIKEDQSVRVVYEQGYKGGGGGGSTGWIILGVIAVMARRKALQQSF